MAARLQRRLCPKPLVEGIHALMAEFYSANLAPKVRKGQSQKAKMGGFPHCAPLGYMSVRQTIVGRTVAHVVSDPHRAPLIRKALWHSSGLTGATTGRWPRGRRGPPTSPFAVHWAGEADHRTGTIGKGSYGVKLGVPRWRGSYAAPGPQPHQPMPTTRRPRASISHGFSAGTYLATARSPPWIRAIEKPSREQDLQGGE